MKSFKKIAIIDLLAIHFYFVSIFKDQFRRATDVIMIFVPFVYQLMDSKNSILSIALCSGNNFFGHFLKQLEFPLIHYKIYILMYNFGSYTVYKSTVK